MLNQWNHEEINRYVDCNVKKQRPVNLNLLTIHFPVTAIVSILHRVSGVITFVALGVLLWLLGLSLSSEEGFTAVKGMLASIWVKLIIWGILTALTYHILGGIRHLLTDFGLLSETFFVGKITSYAVMILAVLFSVLAGVLVW